MARLGDKCFLISHSRKGIFDLGQGTQPNSDFKFGFFTPTYVSLSTSELRVRLVHR